MSVDKIKLIEEVDSIDELTQLLTRILQASSITNVSSHQPFIEGELVNDLGSQSLLFFQTIDHLSKNYEGFDVIKELVQKKIKAKAYSSIFIVSNKNITEGFKDKLSRSFGNFHFTFWGREVLIERIDKFFDEFWRHNDQSLIIYEKKFEEALKDDWSIKKVKQFKAAHEKLLEIFISPSLYHKVHDMESNQKTHVKITVGKLIGMKQPVILQGEPGVGKTRILKEIGHEFILENSKNKKDRYVPILINNIDLIESRSSSSDLVSIRRAVESKISNSFEGKTIEEISKDYIVIFLLDSVDEFNKANQERLFDDLKLFCNEKTRIFLATRFQDYSSIHGLSLLGKAE